MATLPRHAAVLLLLPVLAAACGSSKATTTTVAAGPLTEQQFVKAGNQVCIRSDRRIYKIGRLTRNPVGWAKTEVAARVGIREMEAVKPPAAGAAAFHRMVQYGQALALAIAQAHEALVRKNIEAAAAAQFAAAKLQDKVHQQAKVVGLTFCQQALTNWPA